jgi:iron complex outermembrane receptor protein
LCAGIDALAAATDEPIRLEHVAQGGAATARTATRRGAHLLRLAAAHNVEETAMRASKHHRFLSAIVPALAFAAPAAAQQPAAQDSQQLERVEITGSSIKRIAGQGALPVQVLTRDEIAKTGASSVEQLLQTVSAATSSGAIATSTASSATTGGISGISLRGLTSLRTLVLINGRRIAPYGIGFTNDSVSVDVNSIPLAAIERVEVLKDGASAVYGSDAIGGVVNFILRRDFRGAEISGEYGDTTQGGARSKRASGLLGFGSERFNVMLGASYAREEALYGRERDFARSGIRPDVLHDVTSGNTFPANVVAVDGSAGGNPTAASGCGGGPYASVDPLFDSLFGAGFCRFDPSPILALLPETERASLFGSAKLSITSDLEAFVEASYNRNRVRTIIQPVPLSDQFVLPPNNPLFNQPPYNTFTALGSSTVLLRSTSPFYPTAFVQAQTGGPTPDLLVRYRPAVSGNRDLTDIAEAPRLVLGLRGTAAGWDFDSALLYSQSKVREQVNDGYPINTKILPLLNSGNVNFFGPNPADIDAQIRATNFGGDAYVVKSSLTSLAGKGSREVLSLPAGPLALALGAEVRKEQYRFDPSPELASGDISGYGGNIALVDRSRDVDAVFAEIDVPIVKGLEANAAVRYDRYQGVGNSTTPKVSLRWQPVKQVLLRASAGKGFRAPSLQDLYAPQTTGVTPNGQTDPLRCNTTQSTTDCQTQFPTSNGGNAALKPEKSNNYTLGLVLEPTPSTTVAIDAFKITLKDTIAQGIAPDVILGDLAKYGSFVTRGPVDPNFPNLPGPIIAIDQRNLQLGETRLSGIDLDLGWRTTAGGAGRFAVNLTGTYFIKYDTQNPDGSFTPGVDQINTTTGGVVPRWKHYLAFDWTRGPWNVTLAQNYQKGYTDVPGSLEDTDPTTNPGFKPRKVGAYETYDAQVTYAGFKQLKLTLGVKNLFDRDPPYTNSGGNVSFQSGYDPEYADPRGRFVYLRGTYAF